MARTRRFVTRQPDNATAAAAVNGAGTLVASVTMAEGRGIELGQSKQRPWQQVAWDYWGKLGELYYPTTQIARLLTRMDWNVTIGDRELSRGEPDEDGNPTKDEVGEFLDAVTDGLGRQEAIRLLALNIQVPAECWYVYTGDKGWRVYSIVDSKLSDIRDREDWIRLHVKIIDPRDQRYAISPFSAIIGPAEELLTLEALSRAQSRSRIAQAGILFRPTESQFPTKDADGNDIDPFGDDLQEAMTAPIADEHDPSALMPLVVEQPSEVIEAWRHMQLTREFDDQLHERIDKVVRRIAIGLDIDPEFLLGTGEVNHWGAWLIDESTNKSTVQPLGERVGEVLANAGEALLDLPEGAVTVTPDPGELFARRSTVRDAFQGAMMGAVGLDYVRDAMGAKPEDAPTDEDIALIVALRGGGAGGMAPPSVPQADGPDLPGGVGGDQVDPEPDIGPPDEQGTPIAAALDVDTATGRDLERFGDDLAAVDMQLRDALTGAMAVAVMAARRRVGAKIRTAIRSTPEHDQIADVDNSDVAAKLGARALELVDPEPVVRDSFDRDLAGWWRRELAGARARLATLAGVDTDTAAYRDAAERSVAALVDGLTGWAVSQLPRTDAAMLQIPAGLAREVVAVAGGS